MLRRGPCRVVLGRPLPAGPASATFKHRKTAVVICAAPSKQESDSKVNSSMPRLPPRKKPQQPAPSVEQGKQASKSSSSSSSSRSRPKRLGSFAGGPNQPPPSELPQSVMQEKALAGLLAYTGLMGTVATAVAFFAPGVDLFGGFHWDAADVSLALKLMLPVYGLNLLIMLPNYSSWKLPEVTAESQAAMVEAIAKWSAKKGSKGSSSADASAAAGQHASTTGAGAVASEAPAADAAAAEPAASQQSAEQSADVAPSAPAAADAALASSSIAVAEAGTAESTPTPTSSSSTFGGSSSSDSDDSWFSRQLKSPAVMRARDALYMAQGHYLSLNPAVVLPLPLQATVLLIDCLAAELLYRSVALQLAGGWIGDRIVEAGADDVLDSLLAGMPVLPTHASGQLVTVALLSVASGVLVLRNMRRMARRPQLALGAQGRQAAGQLLTDLQDKHRRQQRQQQQQEQQKKTDDSSSSSSAAVPEPASKVASSPDDKQQQQDSASRAAADWAVAAAKAAAGSQQQQQQGGANMEPQWSRRIPSTLSGLALSQLVQGARDIGQMTALGLSFVLTGNLAAPFAAAVVNQALMAALQKRGLERARQRSIAMAKHLAGITRQLRDAQRKQEDKKRQQQQGKQQQLLAASAESTQDAEPANAAAQGASSASSDPLSSTAAAAAPGAAAGAGNAVAAPPSALAATTAAAGETDAAAAAAAVPDAAAPAGEALVASRMERTIGVLDQLLGQLGETATAGPGPGK